MFPAKLKFQDFNGNEVEQTFYFNISKAELAKMEMRTNGNIESILNKIMNERDSEKLTEIFERLILDTYGVKSDDGIYFWKEDPVDHHRYSDEFKQTDAYNVLFMKLIQDPDYAEKFLEGIAPADLRDQAHDKMEEIRNSESQPEVSSVSPAVPNVVGHIEPANQKTE